MVCFVVVSNRIFFKDNKFIDIHVTKNRKSDVSNDEIEEVNMDEIDVTTLDNHEDLKLSDLQSNDSHITDEKGIYEKKSPFLDNPRQEDDMKVLTSSKIIESNPREGTTDGDWYLRKNTRLTDKGYLFQKTRMILIQNRII